MTESPSDWAVKPLLDIVTVTSGQVDPRLPDFREMPLIAPDHIESATGRLLDVRTAEQQGAISGKYRVDAGDIIYSKIRPYLQKAYLAEFAALCSADMYPLKPNAGVDGNFIVNTLLGRNFTSFAVGVSMRSGIPKINRTELAEYHLAVPPSGEQERIGAALADTDALIGALERLIAKKRDIRRGLMQELLTGRTRLPGFTGEWRTVRLGDLLRVRNGRSQKEVETPHGRYPILATGGEIGRTDTPIYDGPSVLIGRKGTIDRPQFRDQPFWTVDTLFYTEVSPRADARCTTVDWMSLNEATGVPSLTGGRIESVEVTVPSHDEQRAIAGVLLDVDSEIAALDRRLESARNIKQGMMQELLSGRTRLVSEVAA